MISRVKDNENKNNFNEKSEEREAQVYKYEIWKMPKLE